MPLKIKYFFVVVLSLIFVIVFLVYYCIPEIDYSIALDKNQEFAYKTFREFFALIVSFFALIFTALNMILTHTKIDKLFLTIKDTPRLTGANELKLILEIFNDSNRSLTIHNAGIDGLNTIGSITAVIESQHAHTISCLFAIANGHANTIYNSSYLPLKVNYSWIADQRIKRISRLFRNEYYTKPIRCKAIAKATTKIKVEANSLWNYWC